MCFECLPQGGAVHRADCWLRVDGNPAKMQQLYAEGSSVALVCKARPEEVPAFDGEDVPWLFSKPGLTEGSSADPSWRESERR